MRLILAIFLTLLCVGGAFAERRVALVIGADAYRSLRPLDNAVADAVTMRQTLEALGFTVTLETDRDLKRMRRALDDFREDGAGADVALFFFAGHGVEIAGDNRLLPVDADAASVDRLRETSLALDEVHAVLRSMARAVLVVLDACRNDPLGNASAGGRGARATSMNAESV
ncbi:MAG TPA: caspase family protein [Rhizobiales bacterium]|nr:caspase family protein [Hyphomicrobiales bacterium]